VDEPKGKLELHLHDLASDTQEKNIFDQWFSNVNYILTLIVGLTGLSPGYRQGRELAARGCDNIGYKYGTKAHENGFSSQTG
jgi:hypothetical protein